MAAGSENHKITVGIVGALILLGLIAALFWTFNGSENRDTSGAGSVVVQPNSSDAAGSSEFFDDGEPDEVLSFSSEELQVSFQYPAEWGEVIEIPVTGEAGRFLSYGFSNQDGSPGSLFFGGPSSDFTSIGKPPSFLDTNGAVESADGVSISTFFTPTAEEQLQLGEGFGFSTNPFMVRHAINTQDIGFNGQPFFNATIGLPGDFPAINFSMVAGEVAQEPAGAGGVSIGTGDFQFVIDSFTIEGLGEF